MPNAYVIFIREKTTDPSALKRYSANVGKSFQGHQIQFLVAYGAHEVLEGSPVEGVVVLEFPDMAAAKAWYESPAYQEAAKHRFAGAKYQAILVQGHETSAT